MIVRAIVVAAVVLASSVFASSAGAITPKSPLVCKYDRNYPSHQYPQKSLRGRVRFNYRIVKRIAQSVGLPGDLFAQIARGESGYYPGIWGIDPNGYTRGYGLWAVTPKAWGNSPALLRKFYSLGGVRGMFNPINNARMTKMIYDIAGARAWYGVQYVGIVDTFTKSENLLTRKRCK